jgi:3',5'-cyclic AMP phosphodiesterase CpdA
MKIAHFSDLHLYSAAGVPAHRFLNKRLTGWANLRLRRGVRHRASYVRAIAREIARIAPDHVVVTGDLTNLALEPEFELAREVIEHDLGLDAARVTIVPGNHDRYTRGAAVSRRFEHYFAAWLETDLPALRAGPGAIWSPVVKLHDGVAIVGLSSAIPCLPFVASGEIGTEQLAALERVIAHPEVRDRALVLALHHPPVHAWPPGRAPLQALRDGPALVAALRPVRCALVLHGHLHRRIHRAWTTDEGSVEQIGATSASLHHQDPACMAGFNLYELGPSSRRAHVHARVYSPETGEFRVESVPKHL